MNNKAVLWLNKYHNYNREAEHYCYVKWCKAKSREAELFWINCHYLYTSLGDSTLLHIIKEVRILTNKNDDDMLWLEKEE